MRLLPNILTEKELKKLGIVADFILGSKSAGFVECRDKMKTDKMEKLIKTGAYRAVTACCEGNNVYYVHGFAFVNREGYGLQAIQIRRLKSGRRTKSNR